ncbi:MBOAT family O-acyltransferase [Arenibacterium sp. CAU 1754]
MIILVYFFWTKYLPSIMLALGHQVSFLDLAIPIGISYFTFKILHYSIERGRGTLPAHGFSDFAAFMFLAPIFTAGPIERFDHFLANKAEDFQWDFVFEGLLRIAQGLVKKFVLAVVALELLERSTGGDFGTLVENLENVSVVQVWACLFLALLFSYLDFSAYSDIAIGSSRLFGLTIMENFNLPFLSHSLRNFWQRWHMTLASWVLTYIYMPLVGHTRNPYLSIIICFGVVGLWHVAWPPHWLFWGLWHGFGLAALIWWTQLFQKRRSKFLRRGWVRVAGWAITMFYVALSEAFPTLYGVAPLSDAFRIVFAAFGIT